MSERSAIEKKLLENSVPNPDATFNLVETYTREQLLKTDDSELKGIAELCPPEYDRMQVRTNEKGRWNAFVEKSNNHAMFAFGRGSSRAYALKHLKIDAGKKSKALAGDKLSEPKSKTDKTPPQEKGEW